MRWHGIPGVGALSLLAGLCLSSCVESDAVYIVNPDGSGKVEHRLKVTKPPGMNWEGEEPARDGSKNFVRSAIGIEAWDNVLYRMAEGGNAVEIQGTGYFRDINEVALGQGDEDGGHNVPLPRLRMKTDESGSHVFTIVDSAILDDSGGNLEISVNGEPIEGDPADTAQVEEGLGAMKSLFVMNFALRSSYRVEVRMNGSFSDPQHLELAESGNAAIFLHDPESAIQTKEEGASPPEKPKKEEMQEILSGGIVENEKLQELLYGRKPPFTVTVTGAKPSFDYPSELSQADLPVSAEDRGGWEKLESLEP